MKSEKDCKLCQYSRHLWNAPLNPYEPLDDYPSACWECENKSNFILKSETNKIKETGVK